MTPIKAWSESKPCTQHVKIFGSVCYIHIPLVKRTKLDDNAEIDIQCGDRENFCE